MISRRFLISILIVCFTYHLIGQNLVFNGNFEAYSLCPYNQGQIKLATGWDSASSTPDYFNSCAPGTNGFSVPKNTFGFQKDYAGGNGYAGFFVFTQTMTDTNGVREYIRTKLSDTLKANHKYVASMSVNLCNKCDYAISSLGMYFSDTIVYSPNPYLGTFINISSPQVKSMTVISDTLNWVTVRDTFIAQGGELFLTIGNFSTSAESDTTFLYSNSFSHISYYYIDSVTVFDEDVIGINTAVKNLIPEIFPNPTSGIVNLKLTTTCKEILIYNTFGQCIYDSKKPALQQEIDLRRQNSGIYFCKMQSEEGKRIIKIIKIDP